MTANPPTRRRVALVAIATVAALAAAVVCGLVIGPTPIGTTRVIGNVLSYIGIGHSTLTSTQSAILWQLRAPRMVLGLLAGAMLAVAGGTYQGVFRNPLADPYLLGVAAGAGLGATVAIVDVGGGLSTPSWTPILAFAGAMVAVVVTWAIGGRGLRSSTATLILAGVAVASLLTSAQTFLQQQSSPDSIARVYIWLLGSLASANWSSVTLVLPYVAVCIAVCVAAGRALDVMSVGEDESRSLGVPVRRVRFVVIAASSLGTAAIVSAVGLIGFVGIIVPHTVRLLSNASYRVVVPVSMIGGAAFLILADVVALNLQAPAEIPIGVVTAFVGAPFFLFLLRSRRTGVL